MKLPKTPRSQWKTAADTFKKNIKDACEEVNQRRLGYKHDFFISSPMSFSDDKEYQGHKKIVMSSISAIKKVNAEYKCYFAGEKYKTLEEFEDCRDSVEKDWNELDVSRAFIMILPKQMITSCIAEAGYAIARRKPSAYFVQGRKCLPFMLRGIDSVNSIGNYTRVYEYSSNRSLYSKIKNNITKV